MLRQPRPVMAPLGVEAGGIAKACRIAVIEVSHVAGQQPFSKPV